MSMMKTLLLLIALLLMNGRLLALEPLNRIVAVVNDDIIVETQLDNREAMVMKQLQEKQTRLPSREALRKQILERLVLENLQLQLAERSGIRVDDETLNSALRTMATENGMTLAEFRDKLESEGYNYIVFREQLRNEITMTRLRQQMVDSQIKVTDQEVDNMLANIANSGEGNREYRLSHILISVPEAASPEDISKARKRAEKILAKLKAGADFAQTAISESDSQQALEGGDLGWRKADKLPSIFTDTVGKLDKGQISDLIRTPSGFHIIKVSDIRGEGSHLVTQTRACHILLKPSALLSDKQCITKLEQIRERIENGDSFENLARSYSEDPGSASQGGNLGWVSPGQMVPEFEKAMEKLKPGEVSKPVHSRFGWHLIQVLERRSKDNSAEYLRARAREAIRRRKTDEETEIWLRRLRDESYIEYHTS